MDASVVFRHFQDLTTKQILQIEALGSFYADWNAKINVISRKDMAHFYERHVLHSLAIEKLFPVPIGSRVLDVGTGGGFPGIPLAITRPDCEWLLVDSVGKKIKVVQEVIDILDLPNVQTQQTRMEQLHGPFNWVVSRAVAQTKQLIAWTHHLIPPHQNHNGWLLLKGGNLSEELAAIHRNHQVMPLSSVYPEAFFASKQLVFVPR